ncbi:MAG: hypothetical protein HQL56_14400 [Magnetococcales bacterium]|nr:hypothetical protein [Magnetococcales bacterium]
MLELATAMYDEAIVGKDESGPADLVVVMDDVELGNLGQERVIAQHYINAVKRVLQQKSPSSSFPLGVLFRQKCSFHLFKPLPEAYFFGDPSALRQAGVGSASIPPHLVHPTDVEQFESNDPAWLSVCYGENTRRRKEIPWWSHERHPKHYLDYLVHVNNLDYSETIQGKLALQNLNWRAVPKGELDTPLIRSLFQDIADWFQIPNPIGNGSLDPSFYPPSSVHSSSLVLRNM